MEYNFYNEGFNRVAIERDNYYISFGDLLLEMK